MESDGDKMQLVWWQDKVTNAGDSFQAAEKTKEFEMPADSIVYLRASFNYSTSKTQFYYSLDNKKWTALGSETSMGFNLTVFVGARFGLFCYATKTKGGVADFDWFTTEEEYDEEGMYGELKTTLDEKMFTVTKIVPTKKTLDALIGGFISPGITATYKDKHTEVVTSQTVFTPETEGIVSSVTDRWPVLIKVVHVWQPPFTDLFGNQVDTAPLRHALATSPLDQYINRL